MSIDVVSLEGTPYEMGRQHGERLRDEVYELAAERMWLSIRSAGVQGVDASEEDCLKLAAEHLPLFQEYVPAVWEEFRGIAEGAGISTEALFVGNGYTDFRDVLSQGRAAGLSECTSFLVTPEFTREGHALIGQTWDMHASAEAFVKLFHRRPAHAPETLVLSTSGCLSLIGISRAGVAVGNNNLCPTDARPGVMYLSMIHHALAQPDLEAATRAITDAPRSSGHNYVLAGEGQIRDIETTAQEYAILPAEGAWMVHANHYLSKDLVRLEAEPPGISSLHRQKRMEDLFRASEGAMDADALWRFMSDREGGDTCICRTGATEAMGTTCGAAVLSPETGEIWVTRGNPAANEYTRFSFDA